MNSEIKQRIEKLNKGEIPDGYKKTEFGVFPCDWVTDKTFDDLFNFFGGLSKSRDQLGDEGYAYLHYGDLHRGSFNKVSLEQYEQLPKCDITLTGKETCLMEDGDVAFLDASEDLEGTSRAVLIDNPDDKPFIAGLHIIYGKSKDDSLEKWYKQYITSSESVKKQFQRLAVGFKVYGVNRDTLPKIHVAYPPSLQEQSRIAQILMKWDEAIELYNRQIELLTQYKAVCLKKMFPSKGATVPEWRFKGFTDAWEQRKFRDVFDFLQNNTLSRAELTPELGAVKNIHYGDVLIKFGEYLDASKVTLPYISSYEMVEKYKASFLQDGDIIMADTAEDETVGKCSEIAGLQGFPTLSGLHTIPMRTKEKYASGYLGYYMNSEAYHNQLLPLMQGIKVTSISKGAIQDTVISLPINMAEQAAIGQFFRHLDHLITLHQRKFETIQHQRKVLQQYLLNGIVRVKHE